MSDNEKELEFLDFLISKFAGLEMNHVCEDMDSDWFDQFDFSEDHLNRLGEEYHNWNFENPDEFTSRSFDQIGSSSALMFLYYKLRNGKY